MVTQRQQPTTPALLGLEILENSMNDILVAKETLKQTQAFAQRDITAMTKALRDKQARLKVFDQSLGEMATDLATARKKRDELASKMEQEMATIESLGSWQAKQTETIKKMNEKLDMFEEQAHTLRDLHEKSKEQCTVLQNMCDEKNETVVNITARFEQILEERDTLRLEVETLRE